MPVTDEYVIKLPNTKVKFYDMMGWMLIIINLTAFCTLLFYLDSLQERAYASFGILVTIINFGFEWLFRKPHHKSTAIQSSLLYYAIIWLLFFHFYIIGAISLALVLLYYIAKRELNVLVSKERIEYPSFPPRKISWRLLNNVVLKDGLLTIDFRNNKLIQQLIDENNNINEAEFNAYCREQLPVGNKQ
jgi:hypothetical protein